MAGQEPNTDQGGVVEEQNDTFAVAPGSLERPVLGLESQFSLSQQEIDAQAAARRAALEQRFGGLTDVQRFQQGAEQSGFVGRIVSSAVDGLYVNPDAPIGADNWTQHFSNQSDSPYRELDTDFEGVDVDVPLGGTLTLGVAGEADEPSGGLRLSFGGGNSTDGNNRGSRR